MKKRWMKGLMIVLCGLGILIEWGIGRISRRVYEEECIGC